jgi:hypothetical protein
MQTNFNVFIAKFFYFAKCIAYFLPFHGFNYLIRVIFGIEPEYISCNSIDLNNTKYNLITFKLWELTYNNIKNVIVFLSDGDKYIYIYNYKGEVIASFYLIKLDILENNSDIVIWYQFNSLRKSIIYYCSQYIKYMLSPWSILNGNDTFYMHISDKDIFP